MNPRSLGDSSIRVSVCVKDPQKAAALCEKLASAKDLLLLKAIWDQPSLAWAADAILLDGEDIAAYQKVLGQTPNYCPAILVENEGEKSAEEIAAMLGLAPFAIFSTATSSEHLIALVSQAAAHSRMLYSTWFGIQNMKEGASRTATLSGEPTITLESMSSWLKSRQAPDELHRIVGEMFEQWSGATRVLLLLLEGQQLADQLQIAYRSRNVEPEIMKWTWRVSDPLVMELQTQGTPVSAGPQAFRWMQVLGVQYMVPLKAQDLFLGVLAFSDRPNEIPFTTKELAALGAVVTKIGHLLMLGKQARGVATAQKPIAAGPSKELIRKQQLEIIGRMAMRSSHELKNCLVSIRTFTQLFPEKYADEQFRKDFYQVVSKEVERLNGLVEKLLFFAGPVQLKFTQEKITDLISEALTLFGPEDFRNVQLHKVFGHQQPTLWLDRQHMLAVCFHIIQNSLQALGSGGKFVVVTEDHPHPDFPEGVLVVRFLDTGRGMVLKDPDEPFEPFFSTKARGMGLGLTIAKRIVEEHGGTIRLDSSKDKGTEVILCLPRKIPRWDAQATAQNAAEVSP